MAGPIGHSDKYHYKKEPIATLDQDPPVQNVWYPILDTRANVLLVYIAIRQIHDEAGAEDLEVRVTIDGEEIEGAVAGLADSTWNYVYLSPEADTLTISATQYMAALYEGLPGRSIKVEMRQTSALGTNPQLDGRIQHCTLQKT